MVRTAVLVSGGGMNLQALLDARMFGEIPECELTAVISTKSDAHALKRAEIGGVPTFVVERELFPSSTVFSFAILDKLRDLDIQLVVLAGYSCEITQPILKHFGGRIIDTYPALMPAFTDMGIAAEEICRETLKAGVKLTGATAYFVTDTPRQGPIIQQKAVAVRETDTAMTLQRRVLEEGENMVLTRAVALYCQGRLSVENGIVRVDEQLADSESLTK